MSHGVHPPSVGLDRRLMDDVPKSQSSATAKPDLHSLPPHLHNMPPVCKLSTHPRELAHDTNSTGGRAVFSGQRFSQENDNDSSHKREWETATDLFLPSCGNEVIETGRSHHDCESKVGHHPNEIRVSALRHKSLEAFLDEAYCCYTHQVGYRTDGHQCINMRDREEAFQTGSSLLYGEVLPHGVSLMLDADHLEAAASSSLFDLGMGTGKLALQAFLQYPSLKRVVGVELAFSRYKLGERALLNIITRYSQQFILVSWTKGERICIASAKDNRTLEFRRGDLLQCKDVEMGDVAIVQTDFPEHSYALLSRFLHRLERGTKVLSYLNLRRIWDCSQKPFPFTEYAQQSRFPTSWSSKTGHLFFLWRKSLPKCCWLSQPGVSIEGKKEQQTVEVVSDKKQKNNVRRKFAAFLSMFKSKKKKKKAKSAKKKKKKKLVHTLRH